MKNKITTGIWLIFFGLVFLLDNFNVIDFNFYAIWKYWPLLLVSLGLNLILQNRQNGKPILIVYNIIVCAFLGYTGMTSQDKFNLGIGNYANINTETDFSETTPHVSLPYNNETKASLEFNLGAASLTIKEAEPNLLLESNSLSKNVGLKLENDGKDDKKHIILSSATNNTKDQKASLDLGLNTFTTWDLVFNLGAAKFDADLKKHKFSSLEINAGAASLNLKLGHPAAERTKIEINTAASSCEISIPKDAACQIEVSSLMSSKSFDGFQKVDDKLQTENFNSATKKYFIESNGAVSSLKINRY